MFHNYCFYCIFDVCLGEHKRDIQKKNFSTVVYIFIDFQIKITAW